MNNDNASFLKELDGKGVKLVAYAANRTDEVPGSINIIIDSDNDATLEVDDADKLLMKLGVPTNGTMSPVLYRRTGHFSAEEGYQVDIRITPCTGEVTPTHWLIIAERGLKPAGRPLEVDFIEGEKFQALMIPIAKLQRILSTYPAKCWNPLTV